MSGTAPILSLAAPSAWGARLRVMRETDTIPRAYLTAVDSVVELLGRAEVADAWDSPSALAEWRVGGLAGHLAAQAFLGVRLLENGPSTQDPISIDEHYERAAWVGAKVDDDVSASIRAGGDADAKAGPAALVDRVRTARDRVAELLADTDESLVLLVPWQGWSLRRDDLLTTRMMEIAVHSDDLGASVGVSAPALPSDVLDPVLALLTRLALRRHGQSAVLAALTRGERQPGSIAAF
jgi:hypothetical protein